MTYSDFGIDVPSGRRSGKLKTFCPQCHDRRSDKRDKSLSVDIDKGVWKCHYCDWSGTVNAGEFDNSPEARQRWMEMQPWYKPLRRRNPTYTKPMPHTTPAAFSDKLLAWFAERGIGPETIGAMRITEGPEWMPQKGGEVNTVQFNYYLDGELVNTKFRTGDKCFKLVSGARLIPYNIDAVRDTPECIITEGEMDALSFVECGRSDVISVPNGASTNLDYLDDFIEDYFENKRVIYIASDADTKGVALRDQLLARFGADRCRLVVYGEGCKDANEHLLKFGRESLMECLGSAAEPAIDDVYTLRDFEEGLNAFRENGLQRGMTIGHENFDQLCSFETKRLCIVTGIPGSGKSEFIDEIAVRLNLRYGWRTAYFSPENFPLTYHAAKLVEKFTGKRCDSRLPVEEFDQVKRHIDANFSFIYPKDNYKLDTILDRAQRLVSRRGIKLLVIDPYNRLEDERNSMTETQYVSKVLDKLSNFAQRNDVMVILMAHPVKLPKNKDGGIEAPTLYDISGSANFFNKADFGIVVHRNDMTGLVHVNVEKVKFRHLGNPGVAMFNYNLNNGRYVPSEPGRKIEWDNSNLLTEMYRRKDQESFDAAQLPLTSITINNQKQSEI